jgi:hypothetical protein
MARASHATNSLIFLIVAIKQSYMGNVFTHGFSPSCQVLEDGTSYPGCSTVLSTAASVHLSV